MKNQYNPIMEKTKRGRPAKGDVIEASAKTPTREVAVQPKGQFDIEENTAERLMAQAITGNVPVEIMERLMSMRKELKAEWAKEQYNAAMAKFQSECPVIEKRKVARDEERKADLYKYAPLDDIVTQVQDLIARHGFSYTFRQENDGNKVRVSCIVSHISGHSEESVMETGLATKTRIMSGPQQIASTVSFNKRYAFCNAFGIMTGDEDVDAAKRVIEPEEPKATPVAPSKPVEKKATPSQFIDKTQASEINRLVKTLRMQDAKKEIENVVERDINELKELTGIEAAMVIDEFTARLEKIKTAPTPNLVDPSVNQPEPVAKENVGLPARAMNCKTQEEARDIVGEATLSKDISEVKMTALKNILISKGFTV